MSRHEGVFVRPADVEAHLACGWRIAGDCAHDRVEGALLVPPGASLATDFGGTPDVVVHHQDERGAGERSGQWAVVCVRRWLRRDGDVAMVSRTIVGWCHTQAEAAGQCLRLDGPAGGAS